MRRVGLFEAKAKLSELCAAVARDREAVVITRRGKPLVRLEPVAAPRREPTIWQRRAGFLASNGPIADFALPERRPDPARDPLR